MYKMKKLKVRKEFRKKFDKVLKKIDNALNESRSK